MGRSVADQFVWFLFCVLVAQYVTFCVIEKEIVTEAFTFN